MAPKGCDLKGPIMTLPSFPTTRLRRLRATPALRAMVQESTLAPADFIWPVFVMDGKDCCEPVASMPGVMRHSVDRIGAAAAPCRRRLTLPGPGPVRQMTGLLSGQPLRA